MAADGFEARLQEWLSELPGVTGERRVVRHDATRVLLSKFEPGFAPRLFEALERVPQLVSEPTVRRAYTELARERPGAPRVALWHEAIVGLLESHSGAANLGPNPMAEIQAGLDSVAAVMDSVLWSTPLAGDSYTVAAGEIDAFRDVLADAESDGGIFTRFYGTFEGRSVLNHCPAAQIARGLLAQAWSICTGEAAPR
ncbi:MAG: hypothetical protein ABI305_07510 [Tepidiformaceae bacterium]